MATSILIVEDDSDIQECLKIFLELEGYKITTAFNGKEALALLESGVKPNLILLDLMMPIMNGYEFLTYTRNTPFSKIPIVLLSASTDLEETAKNQVVRLVKKPIDLDLFLKTIEETCTPASA